MKVMGCFGFAANPRWAKRPPDLSYGPPTAYHSSPLSALCTNYSVRSQSEFPCQERCRCFCE